MKTTIKTIVADGKEGAEITQYFGQDNFSFVKEEDPTKADCARVVTSQRYYNREFKKHDWTAIEGKIWSRWFMVLKVEDHKEVRGKQGSRVTGKQITLNKKHLIAFANNLLKLAEKMEDNDE